MKKLICLLVLVMMVCGCAEAAKMPTYTVLDEQVYDTPGKTQVKLEILTSGEITEEGLRTLLNKLYTSISKRRGFKYHTNPTNIYIYAFTSKEHYKSGMGQWIAMLDKGHSDVKPNIRINKRQVAQIGAKPEEKFGLSETKRKEIYQEIVKAEDKSYSESEKAYPLPDIFKPDYSQSIAEAQLKKQGELQDELYEKYKSELAEKYKLTRERLDEIVNEGFRKVWPMFPMPE